MYIYIYVHRQHAYVCMYVCMYACMYVYININTMHFRVYTFCMYIHT